MTELLGSEVNVYKLWALLGAPFLLIVILLLKHGGFRLHASRSQIALFLVCILILLHAILFSESIDDSLMIILGIAWFACVGLTVNIFSPETVLKYAHKFLVITGYFFLGSSLALIGIFGYETLSVAGNFVGYTDNANYLGLILSVFLFPLYLSGLYFNKKNTSRIMNAIFLAICLFVILLTRSRAAILTITFTSLFFLIFLDKPSSRMSKSVAIKVISFTVIVITFYFAAYDILVAKYSDLSIFSTREHLFMLRMDAIQSRPFTGWGFRVNEFTILDQFNQFNKGEKGNTVLALIEEFGIFFGFIVLFSLTSFYYQAINFFVLRQDLVVFGLILFSSIVHLQAETWLFNFLGIPGLFIWLLIYIGLCNYKLIMNGSLK